jgi:uncharacterized membrane protein
MDLSPLYPWLKTGHVLLAIVAVGFNFTYGILIRRAAAEPEHFGHVLRTVKFLDDRFATPAYLLLPVLGVAMVFIGGWDLATPWILSGLALYALLVVVGAGLYSPTLRGQIAALDRGGPGSPEFRQLTLRGNRLGALLGLLAVVIVAVMVLKPSLWG